MLHVAPGDPIATDAVVTLPASKAGESAGSRMIRRASSRSTTIARCPGWSGSIAAGDVTTFPVKQGGIAAQEADAAAEAIAAELGCATDPAPFEPILRGVLWTGAEPRYVCGHLTGGHGETSILSSAPPWADDEGKIVGWHLTPFLAEVLDNGDRALLPSPS